MRIVLCDIKVLSIFYLVKPNLQTPMFCCVIKLNLFPSQFGPSFNSQLFPLSFPSQCWIFLSCNSYNRFVSFCCMKYKPKLACSRFPSLNSLPSFHSLKIHLETDTTVLWSFVVWKWKPKLASHPSNMSINAQSVNSLPSIPS